MVEGFDVNDLRSEVMRHEQERNKDLKNAGYQVSWELVIM